MVGGALNPDRCSGNLPHSRQSIGCPRPCSVAAWPGSGEGRAQSPSSTPTLHLHSVKYLDTIVYVNRTRRLTRRESQEVTRARLIEAAERVFIRFGFDAASVEQIAEAAGFSRGAFYSNFADKDSLFLAVLNKRRLETAKAVEEIFLQNPDAAQRLRAVRDWYVTQWQQKQWITLRTEFQLRALRNRAVRTRLARILRQELETYSALVAQYFAQAGTAMADRPETIALSLVAMAEGLGSIALVDAEWASGLGFAEAPNLVFNRLLAIPGKEAGATLK